LQDRDVRGDGKKERKLEIVDCIYDILAVIFYFYFSFKKLWIALSYLVVEDCEAMPTTANNFKIVAKNDN